MDLSEFEVQIRTKSPDDSPLDGPTDDDASGEKSTAFVDPRWPYLSRWTTNSHVPLSAAKQASPTETVPILEKSEEIVDPRLSVPLLADNLEMKSLQNPGNHIDSVDMETSGGDGTAPPNSAEVVSDPPSSAISSPLGAWSRPIKIISPTETSLVLAGQLVGGKATLDLSSPVVWPVLSGSQNGQNSRHVRIEVSKRNMMKDGQKRVHTMEDDLRFPWAAKMNPSSRNLYRATEPEYLEDGTPKVTIPSHVLLQGLENQKEYILGRFYRCSPPSGGLIYAVLNKLWGRKCKITIRKLGESNYLFHIPDESTRIWVLQRGLWHVDDCLMFVASWTPEATLAIPEIKTIPIWVTLKKIPNILYSIPGISHIASGLGAPMATHKPRLDPILMGEAKILVEVELSKAFPKRIAASDETGFISMVDVEYAWLPPKCGRCGQLGHKIKRCLQSDGSQVDVTTLETGTEKNLEAVKTISTPAIRMEVHHFNNSVLPSIEPITIDISTSSNGKDHMPPSTTPITENVSGSIASPKVQASITSPKNIESPLLETAAGAAGPSITTPHHDIATVQMKSIEQVKQSLGANKFASLAFSEGDEDSLDSDKESDSRDLLTPLGKRILRERPVKPSTKVKEMDWLVTGGGRGNRGRGNRGGRG